MERYCCNVICGTPTTSGIKGLRDERECLAMFLQHVSPLAMEALAHYICYLSKDINLTSKEEKLEFV